MIALCHSELSEALEEYRKGMPKVYYNCMSIRNETDVCGGDLKCCKLEGLSLPANDPSSCILRHPKPEGMTIELIDCIIRILDYLASVNADIDAALEAKMEYNATRKYRHGGKVC